MYKEEIKVIDCTVRDVPKRIRVTAKGQVLKYHFY
jgi:hypothetical protein